MTQLEQTNDQIPSIDCVVQPIDGSAIRSHESFTPDVHAICHHSGRYLTLKETHPKYFNLFREQHDFPGFPELDRSFATAAHAASYQHISWSRYGIAGSCMIVSAIFLLGMVALLQGHQDQVANDIEAVIVNGALVGGGVIGVGLMGLGIISIARRFDKYHQAAQKRGERPVIDDFPLLQCRYELQASENVRINFANTDGTPPPVVSDRCTLTVRVIPDMEPNRIAFDRYQTLYHQHQIGQSVMAGTLALADNGAVCLTHPTHLEYNHRLLLRTPAEHVFGPPDTHDGAVNFHVPYQVNVSRRFVTAHGDPAPPLTCFVHLANSYQINLHFHWHDQGDATLMLKECQLAIPETLRTSVDQVQAGRFEPTRQRIIWRSAGRYDVASTSVRWHDIPFDEVSHPTAPAAGLTSLPGRAVRTHHAAKALVLSVVFSQPLLKQEPLPQLKGTYHCVINDLISGLTIRPQSVWDARGIRVTDNQTTPPPTVRTSTHVRGNLHFHTNILLQEHEYTCSTRIPYRKRADHVLVGMVLDTLVKWNVTIQRVEEAAPRFDFTGKQLERLSYWDIIGYRYDLDTLDSFDIHVVITGDYQRTVSMGADPHTDSQHQHGAIYQSDDSIPHTNLELTIRCMHDPRNDDSWKRADTLLWAIAQDLKPFEASPPDPPATQVGSCTIANQLEITLIPNGDGWHIQAQTIAPTPITLREVAVTLIPPPNLVASVNRFEFGEMHVDTTPNPAPLTLRMYNTDIMDQRRTQINKDMWERAALIEELEERRRLALTPVDRRHMQSLIEDQEQQLQAQHHKLQALGKSEMVSIKVDVTYLVDDSHIVTRHEGTLHVNLLAQ